MHNYDPFLLDYICLPHMVLLRKSFHLVVGTSLDLNQLLVLIIFYSLPPCQDSMLIALDQLHLQLKTLSRHFLTCINQLNGLLSYACVLGHSHHPILIYPSDIPLLVPGVGLQPSSSSLSSFSYSLSSISREDEVLVPVLFGGGASSSPLLHFSLCSSNFEQCWNTNGWPFSPTISLYLSCGM
jgi:hypothetical protein